MCDPKPGPGVFVMTQFLVTPAQSPRFNGQFTVAAAPGPVPTEPESEYLDLVQKLLVKLDDEETSDAARSLPDALRTNRRTLREEIAAKLQADIAALNNGSLSISGAKENAKSLQKKYDAVQTFGIRDKASPSIEGEFELVQVKEAPSDDEAAYLKYLEGALKELGDDEKSDKDSDFSPALVAARSEYRKTAVANLRKQAADFCQNKDAKKAAENALVEQGTYRGLRDRLKKRLFSAQVVPKGKVDADFEKLAVDLQIGLIGGLPAPEDAPSPDKQDLFVEINKATTVIRTVSQRAIEGPTSWWTGKQHTPEKFVVERAQRAQDEYISKLRGIALVGLEGRQTPLAKLALKELKAEFAARVGTRIKTKYARWLAFWSGLVSVGLLLVYCFLQYKYPEWKWGQDHRIFLLAAMGAAIGAWLSFSIRQVEFVFEDLLLLEDDASDPPLRIAFVVILTWTAFLLFWLGAINVEVGGISTKPEVLKLSGTLSVLIGIFFGLSERALSTALSGRATAFVKGVAGGT